MGHEYSTFPADAEEITLAMDPQPALAIKQATSVLLGEALPRAGRTPHHTSLPSGEMPKGSPRGLVEQLPWPPVECVSVTRHSRSSYAPDKR